MLPLLPFADIGAASLKINPLGRERAVSQAVSNFDLF